jgi:hypothetical protein
MSLSVTSIGDNQQAPGITAETYIPDQLIAGDLKLISDSVTITGGADLVRGSLLGAVTIGAAGAAVAGGGNTGNAMGVGCLPTSTAGLLLSGDMVEINGELKIVNAALNSDGLGNGWLQFNPALFRTPNSGDPVIVGTPMGKFIINGNPSWTNQYGVYADLELTMDAINE